MGTLAEKAQFGHTPSQWKSWEILTRIEGEAGKPSAAAEARRNAVASYLAYRRDGGENHSGAGRLVFAVTKALLEGKRTAAMSVVQQEIADLEAAGFGSFGTALQAIVAGSRDRSLADAPDLRYDAAAEILFLIEQLER